MNENPNESATTEEAVTPESLYPVLAGLEPYVSPTLARLPKSQRPNPSTVCEACPGSVWLASANQVKCYCRVMHLVTWSTEDQTAIQHCDGEVMANVQRATDAGL